MDDAVLSREFIKENEAMISLLDIDHDAKLLLENIHEFYKNKDILDYARIQLGLAKALDFFLSTKQMASFQQQINRVVTLAYQIVQIHINKCNQSHEDGACLVGE